LPETSPKKEHWSKRLKAISKNPYLNILVGIVILVGAGQEVVESFEKDLQSFSLGTQHGLLLLAIAQILKALPDLVDVAEKVEVIDEGLELAEVEEKLEQSEPDAQRREQSSTSTQTESSIRGSPRRPPKRTP
jgi:hypothetical protein